MHTYRVEVAYYISILMDMAGIDEIRKKDDTPKGYFPVGIFLGHMVKSHMTVIFIKDGELLS